MTSLIFSFFLLFGILSSSADTSILNDKNGLLKRTEAEVTALFETWTMRQGKAYNSLGERKRRFEIFKDNLSFIDKRNAMNLTYKLGLTRFADLTNEEYQSMYFSRVDQSWRSWNGSKDSDRYAFKAGDNLPKSVDWREKGAVLPYVKNQSQCQNCWAFSAVATVEGLNQIVTGKLISLSEQELTDCSRNRGCRIGSIDLAFQYIIENGGIDTEEHYPFKGVSTQCNPKRAKVVSIDQYERVTPPRNEKSLRKAVANQPISVAIEATDENFQLYESGVFTGPCGTTLNHFATAVGYGSEKDLDYWIVRNSWGPNWGEKGYIRMGRNMHTLFGTCGITKYALYPIMKGKKFPNPEKKVWSS